ncbi:hypothetical protein [Prosthecobacter vanneervenii]|uniref:Uncharacterized protein n=1 Tax=Prosthecobacter vanneervenii TaxID=48466 RepID=A0A7W7YC50_9BACT|nr:hypothetical protein [Prosthecobacter vanneervenii]MBB5033135.1 hypothetical protein [Prosthecobacter vanneervenii]
MSRYCTIQINGKLIRIRVDKDGVQRLPRLRALDMLFYCGALDLNKLATAVKSEGTCTVETRRWVYQHLGFSVSAYADVFPQDTIINPLWSKSNKPKP